VGEDRNNSLFIVFLLLLVTFIGVAGYAIIEGWTLTDALYMTVITLTTTGYGEVHKLSDEGRVFTIFLLLVGMGTVAYSVTTLMKDLLSVNFLSRRRKKMQNRINHLKGHTIICGYGRMGRVICKELEKNDYNFVVIEKGTEPIAELERSKYIWINGDATHDDVLIQAGVQHARFMVSMVDSDADGLYISLAARSLNPNIYIITRANEESAQPKILRAGANRVILPVLMSGLKVAQSVLNPAVEDFLDITGIEPGSKRLQLADIDIKQGSVLVGKNLRNCGFPRDGLIVVGIKHKDGSFVFAPKSDYDFQIGDCLITLGKKAKYDEVAAMAKPS
jgi:voltage-gated potassium channel